MPPHNPSPMHSCCSAPLAISPSASSSPRCIDLERHGNLKIPVIGVARSDWTDAAFCQNAHDAIIAAMPNAEAAVIDSLMKRLDLIQGDYSDHKTWASLKRTLDKHKSETAVFYMAIPPSMFPTVAQSLASVGLNERGRIVVEKPFGRDLASAIELNATLHSVFPEERIFRIDHYLGKESVEDMMVFRFSNTLLEPVWNRNYVRSVQITMSETIGVEGRGSFYDGVGAIRDVDAEPPAAGPVARGDGATGRPGRQLPAGREGQGLRGDATDRSDQARARPVRRLPRRAGRRAGFDRRDLSPRRVSRSTRGVGPACRGTSAAARR